MKPEKLLGRLVEITDTESDYFKHWGYVIAYDGESFHVSGGSISDNNFNLAPMFDRDQFKCPTRYSKYKGTTGLWIDLDEVR